MLFLLELYFVFFVMFVTSLFVYLGVKSDSTLEQKDLHISYGFILYTLWSATLFIFVPIQLVFLFGMIYISVLLLFKYKSVYVKLASGYKEYFKLLCIYFALLNLFLLPMLMSGSIGSFSEGGGDITIYANTALLLVEKSLPAGGYEIFARQINELLPYVKIPESFECLAYNYEFPFEYYNFPYAITDSAILVKVAKYPSGVYAPTAEWFFACSNSHAIFFALLGFLYASVIYSFFNLIKLLTDDKRFALVAMILLAASHSFISAYYNMYLLQAVSSFLLIFTLRLCLLNATLIPAIVTAIAGTLLYSPFLPIYCALILYKVIKDRHSMKFWEYNSYKIDWIKVPFALFTTAIVCTSIGGEIFEVLVKLFEQATKGANESTAKYFGDSYSMVSREFIAFLTGLLSQQHFQPFSTTPQRVMVLVGINYSLFVIISVLIVVNFKKYKYARHKLLLAISSLLIVLYVYGGRGTMYTQAKTIQYVIILVYLLYVYLAFVIVKNTSSQKFKMFYSLVFILFVMNMTYMRCVYGRKIKKMNDRTAVIDTGSITKLTDSIKENNKDAIVLFEPRKSSDVYLVPHLFAYENVKYVPTKDLALYYRKGDINKIERDIVASYFVNNNNYSDVYHVKYSDSARSFVKEKFFDITKTNVIFTTHYHESDYRKETINDRELKITYIRNGNALFHFSSEDIAGKTVKLYLKHPHDDNKKILDLIKDFDHKITNDNWIEVTQEIPKSGFLKTPKIWTEYFFAYKTL